MTELLYILENISLPILLMILVGFGFQKIFHVDVRTLTKLMMYLLIPVLIFVKVIDVDMTWDLLLTVVGFTMLLEVAVFIVGWGTGRLLRQTPGKRGVTVNSMVLLNTGNYGIPLVDLAFSANPMAAASQLFIVVIQNIMTQTVGVWQVCKGCQRQERPWKAIVKMPTLYVMVLAVLLRSWGVEIPKPVMIPLNYMSDAFIAVALMVLGMQLAEVKLGEGLGQVMIVSVIKVVTATLLGFALVLALGIKGMLAQALIIGISTPSGVNTVVLSAEFDAEPGYAAQLVLMTTVMCTFTLPLIISFVRQYFA
jgi:predicted permease